MTDAHIGMFLLILLAPAAAALIFLHRKKRKTASGTGAQDDSPKPQTGDQETGTIGLWDDASACRVTLTDVHFPDRSYEKIIETSLTIGYSRDSDVCVNYDKTVSRRHCEIVREGSGLYLVNHSRSNGTLLNGYQVLDRVPLSSGGIIKMGRVEMRVHFSF